MSACARYIRLSEGTKVSFVPGEASLRAMTNTKATTTNAPFLADGILRLPEMDGLEICLLKTSNAYNKAGRAKISFDHHKAMFALLSMIRNLVQDYQYAGYEYIKQMKFYFIHALGEFK